MGVAGVAPRVYLLTYMCELQSEKRCTGEETSRAPSRRGEAGALGSVAQLCGVGLRAIPSATPVFFCLGYFIAHV